jgi:hypothetical protein
MKTHLVGDGAQLEEAPEHQLRRLWAIEEGTCDTSESEVACTQDQRASTSSSLVLTLRPDPSTSRLASSSGECDTVATNAVQDPQRTPLGVVAFIRLSRSSAIADIDVTSKDEPSALPSTKSQTHTAKDHRASSSAFASHRAASSTISYLEASSRRSASQTQPGSGPSSRSQICVTSRSCSECHPFTLWNSVTSSPTTSTRAVSPSKRPSTNSMAEDTAAQNAVSSPAISIWRRVASHIASDK